MKTGIEYVGRNLDVAKAKRLCISQARKRHQKDGLVHPEKYHKKTGNVSYRVLGTLENRRLSVTVKPDMHSTAYEKAKIVASRWLAAGHLVETEFNLPRSATVRAL